MFLLNDNQEKIVNEAIYWYHNSSDWLFQFDGKAGTGKSVVLNEIVRRLGLDKYETLPMAYTGQAAIIMRKKGLTNAVTCHSGLFTFDDETVIDKATGMPVMDLQFNTPVTRQIFIPKDFRYNTAIKLILIDEAWMVPLTFRKYIEDTGIKTVVTGDGGQLPPVKDKPAFLIDGKIYHLTQLMRQAEYSPIVYLANRAREGLPIEYGLYGNDVWVTDEDQVNIDLISRSNIVICCKNATKDNINKMVRSEVLHTSSPTPIFGERMVCKKNDWNLNVQGISLANGLVGTVMRPPTIDGFDGKAFRMDFLPDLLDVPFEDLYCDYKYLNASPEQKAIIRNSKYSVGEKFDYAYASTVHTAQGSEYNCGIYFEEYLGHDIQRNLNYTAITRFKNKLIYVKHRNRYY